MRAAYVVDTSYLLELYRVPARCTEAGARAVRARVDGAVTEGNLLVVTVGCILEVGNHIAHVDDGRERRRLAGRLRDDVGRSLDRAVPWTLVPAAEAEGLRELLREFARQLAAERVGLTDAGVIHEARRLAREYSGLGHVVHIWTKDTVLKACEPDPEPDPYVGDMG